MHLDEHVPVTIRRVHKQQTHRPVVESCQALSVRYFAMGLYSPLSMLSSHRVFYWSLQDLVLMYIRPAYVQRRVHANIIPQLLVILMLIKPIIRQAEPCIIASFSPSHQPRTCLQRLPVRRPEPWRLGEPLSPARPHHGTCL